MVYVTFLLSICSNYSMTLKIKYLASVDPFNIRGLFNDEISPVNLEIKIICCGYFKDNIDVVRA